MTRIPLHPLLFAMLPVLSMFAANPGQRHAHELTDALRIVVGMSGLLLLVAAAVYRDARKAALSVSVLFLVLWLQVGNTSTAGWPARYVMPVMYLAMVVGAVWLFRRRAPLAALTGFANIVALGAVLPPVITLSLTDTPSALEASSTTAKSIVAGPVTTKPDIYYLIFDRYGDEQTSSTYGFDNDIDEYPDGQGLLRRGCEPFELHQDGTLAFLLAQRGVSRRRCPRSRALDELGACLPASVEPPRGRLPALPGLQLHAPGVLGTTPHARIRRRHAT